ncbi:pupal cuticle protein Edg-78E-like [Drosophila innubila]|uniref:pupal cuticle protein Edg-78E-like n=1 Tax=Drosophila innubila TaxID=198719 RepID=UPI00148D2C44|nr:pupal cuticle protein Edg-78E-like [Drosophila innubila]
MFKLSLCLIAALLVCANSDHINEDVQILSESNSPPAGNINGVSGESEFNASDGIVITYVADDNGYQPQGDHLPTPPPIPESIRTALEYVAAHPPK